MKPCTILPILSLFLLALYSCSKIDPELLVVKSGEMHTHEASGLQVRVRTVDVADLFDKGGKYLFDTKEGDIKALAEGLGVKAITNIEFMLPTGGTKTVTLDDDRMEPFQFSSEGRAYVVTLAKRLQHDSNEKDVTLTFRIREISEPPTLRPSIQKVERPAEDSTMVMAIDSTGRSPESLVSDVAEPEENEPKYVVEESTLYRGKTYNDEKTGLFVYITNVDEDTQTVTTDVKYPADTQKRKRVAFESGVSQPFRANGKSYSLTFTEVEGSLCTLKIAEN